MDKCQCCNRESEDFAGVACSALGPFSLLYCKECASNYAEPKETILGTIEDCGGLDGVRDEVKDTITYFEDGRYKKMSELV